MNRSNPEFSIGIKIMESAMDFGVRIAKVLERDTRYDVEAYSFVLSALHYTLRKLGEHRHISGKELLEGIREYALREYGPMARTVLEHWGVRNTMDFGEIVFNLVDVGLVKRRPSDSKEEFRNVYDFRTAFDEPFQRHCFPKSRLKKR